MAKRFGPGYIVHVSEEDYGRILNIIERYQKNIDSSREQQRASRGTTALRATKPKPVLNVIYQAPSEFEVDVGKTMEAKLCTKVVPIVRLTSAS